MVQIPRLASRGDPGPGWWPATLDGERTAWLKCPGGHAGSLIDHTIAGDGRVTPSVVCSDDACAWHVFVQLVGWG